ncbi:protease modulator HflC [Oceanidesulfovibrio indonesiensis]|uniref:Protein HflC n=1 Tax=Oceanidesulfovibrio indonesiensis TaxID=54767 RepID=A0A7M3MIW8_9BACT|nr:protease modulator HflC [Oceanidesulfovibrio indonesiensis]TVM19715.1 protease modulator HflC [Oceanidesulfovibrio indonesiensis]
MKKSGILLILLFVALFVVSQVFFTVHQTQYAIVLQLGKPVGGTLSPGLHMKKPLIQTVEFFDKRIQDYDMQPTEVLTSDKKNLVVDSYFKWRITDPLQFYRTVRTIPSARARLDDVIYSELREALGRHTLTEIVAEERGAIMEHITTEASDLVAQYGIELLDVRIKRTELPPQNEQAIFNRMRAERERQAKQYRSEGREEAAKIRSSAEKDRAVIVADARRESDAIRGEGEAEAIKLYAQALEQGPEFYAFQRSLTAYRKSIGNNTRLLLTPENEFLRYFE